VLAAYSAKAREECPEALIGAGEFWSHIVLPDWGPPRPPGHIFTSNPFDSDFTIAFSIRGRLETPSRIPNKEARNEPGTSWSDAKAELSAG
jgi:hypothetical protein